MPPSCLLAIDVQRGFLNRWTQHLPARIEALQARYDLVFVTRFRNPEGSPYRRLMGWERFAPGSADTELAFRPRADAVVIDKSVYTCVTPAFLAALADRGARRVHLAGIATDNCVLKCAVDLFEAGIEPVVLAGHCASHGGPACHEAGLAVLRRLIGPRQVVAD